MDRWLMDEVIIMDLIGKTIGGIEVIDSRELYIVTKDGYEYIMYHDQDCCESVYLDDICGDLDDLIESPILMAEETSNSGWADGDHYTWTFYHISTIKGTVTLKWWGESNGYYSEEVRIVRREL